MDRSWELRSQALVIRELLDKRCGHGVRNLGVKGVGSLRETGEERPGSGIPKVAGNGKNRNFFLQHFVIFCNRNSTKRQEPLRKGREPGNRDYKVHEAGSLDPPVHPHR